MQYLLIRPFHTYPTFNWNKRLYPMTGGIPRKIVFTTSAKLNCFRVQGMLHNVESCPLIRKPAAINLQFGVDFIYTKSQSIELFGSDQRAIHRSCCPPSTLHSIYIRRPTCWSKDSTCLNARLEDNLPYLQAVGNKLCDHSSQSLDKNTNTVSFSMLRLKRFLCVFHVTQQLLPNGNFYS